MAVAFDAVGPGANGAATNGTSLGWTHNCVGSSNLLLVVGVAVGIANDTGITASVTCNGTAMTTSSSFKVESNGINGKTDGYVQMFYFVAPSSSNSISVSTSATVDITAGSISFTGVDQTTPVGTPVTASGDNTGGTSPPTATVSSSTGNLVVDALCYGQAIDGATGTQRWINSTPNFNSAAGNAAQSTYTGASSVTIGYNTSGLDWWGLVGLDIHSAPQTPTVTTQAVTNIAETSATGNGTVVADGGSTITQRGVCWNTSANPTTSNSTATTSGTTGSYSVSITGLTDNTLYHARAYAINANGTSYGSDVTFQHVTTPLSWISA